MQNLNVKSVSPLSELNKSVKVTWVPPLEANGNITGYKLIIRESVKAIKDSNSDSILITTNRTVINLSMSSIITFILKFHLIEELFCARFFFLFMWTKFLM